MLLGIILPHYLITTLTASVRLHLYLGLHNRAELRLRVGQILPPIELTNNYNFGKNYSLCLHVKN